MNINKSVMDGFDAPQWTDFSSSPQISDDFFSRLHPEHELEYNTHLKQSRTKYKEKQLFLTNDESGFEAVLDEVQITPIKVLSPNKSHKDEKVLKETTVGNLLLEAMHNLELSTKKKHLNQSLANSSINTCKTPQTADKRITRSMKATINCENTLEISSNTKLNESRAKTAKTPRKKVSKNILNEVAKIEGTTTTKVPSDEQQRQEIDETDAESESKLKPSNIVTSFNSDKSDLKEITKEKSEPNLVPESVETKSNDQRSNSDEPSASSENIEKTGTNLESQVKYRNLVLSWGSDEPKDSKETKKLTNPVSKKRPHVVATSIRRKSLLKPKSNERFKPFAESVSKFQKDTPKRFHSIPAKNAKPTTSKQTVLKITRPVSPNLTSKNRIRPIKPVDKKSENPTLQKIRNGPVKADAAAISVPPTTKTAKQTKKPMKPESVSKKNHFSSSESLNGNPHDTHMKLDHSVHKKVVSTIVSTDDAKFAVKEVEIGHFGIPTDTNHKPKKFTRALPFSFEVRNKELQEKKEQRWKKMQLQELEKKADSQPKPGPSNVPKESGFLKKKVTPLKNPKETSSAKKTTPRPFSFEERDKQLMKKKDDLIKEALEKDRKGREFHANPVPEFRPVIVRGRSRENLRSVEKTPEKNARSQQTASAPKLCAIKKDLFPATRKFGNQENKEPIGKQCFKSGSVEKLDGNSGTKKAILSELKLNTDKRAKERKAYEDRLKMKELAEEELRKKREEERLLREKAEIAEMRKMTETKARPVPLFKPLAVIKSNKVLTDPQSPAWAYKKNN